MRLYALAIFVSAFLLFQVQPVIARLILLSILVGVVLHAIGLDPWNILDSLRGFIVSIWNMGFDAIRWVWRYFLLGAALVIPIWFIVRLVRATERP